MDSTHIEEHDTFTHRVYYSAKRAVKSHASGGNVLIVATILALVVANIPGINQMYNDFWEQEIRLQVGSFNIFSHAGHPMSMLQFINDALMAIFFFTIGLEIKREVLVGELSSFKQALLPIIAAIGGMVVPVGIYLMLSAGTDFSSGAAIPMATDIAFALGVLTAEKMQEHFRNMQRLHWRQLVVLGEVLLLFLVGFLPQEQNLLANAIVSFSCAMQVQAFRKVNGYAFASTMCIGDLRSGVEALCVWSRTRDPKAKDRMLRYFGIILLFALGSGLGSKSCVWLGGRTIWISCGLLLVSFALMFIREEIEENPAIEKDLAEIRQETREIDRTLKQELKEEREELHEELHEKLR